MILERLMSGQKPLVSAQGMSFFSLTEDNLLNQVVSTPSHFHYQSDGQRHRDKAKRDGVKGDPLEGVFCPTIPDKAQDGWLLCSLWCKFLARPQKGCSTWNSRSSTEYKPQESKQRELGDLAAGPGRAHTPHRAASFWHSLGSCSLLWGEVQGMHGATCTEWLGHESLVNLAWPGPSGTAQADKGHQILRSQCMS